MLSELMVSERLQKIEGRIEQIKRELSQIGEMRPGSLSKQYNVCGKKECACKHPIHPKKHGPYHQLSYTHKRKSTSQFIREKFVQDINQEISNYKKFKELTEEWVSLSIECSKLTMELAKKGGSSK